MHSERIAEILLNGAFEHESMVNRLATSTGYQKFSRKLVKRMLTNFGSGSRPSVRSLGEWIFQDKGYQKRNDKGWDGYSGSMIAPEMAPDMRAASDWKIPSITSPGNLALWLTLPFEKMDWFAGDLGQVDVSSKLSHYVIETVTKPSGGIRVLEKPKSDTKETQRRILHGILDHIPAHPCSHGFQKGRSIMTYVKPHVGKRVVIKLDLKDYFLSVERSRVRALFHLAGYPPAVSQLISGICTHRLSAASLPRTVKSRWKYETYHLPQGAPTSPALADRLLFRLDMRLSGLAKHMKIPYTRYADDIAFSTDDPMMTGKRIDHFLQLVRIIITEEGFQVNEKKTRVMPRSQRQRLAGLVVNQKTNLERSEYDRLKAIIYRCAKNGYEAENRKSHPAFAQHLQGRVEFVRMTHPKRGDRLQALLDTVGA